MQKKPVKLINLTGSLLLCSIISSIIKEQLKTKRALESRKEGKDGLDMS